MLKNKKGTSAQTGEGAPPKAPTESRWPAGRELTSMTPGDRELLRSVCGGWYVWSGRWWPFQMALNVRTKSLVLIPELRAAHKGFLKVRV